MKPIEEWISWGKQNKKMLYFYDQQVLDLTQFVLIHPGGRKALSSYLYKDITDILFAVYPHQKEITIEVLKRYVIGTHLSFPGSQKSKKQNLSTSNKNRNKKKVCFENSTTINQTPVQTSLKNCIDRNSTQKQKIENNRSKKSQKKQNSPRSKKYQVSLTIIPDKLASQGKLHTKQESKVKEEDIDSHIKQSQMEESNKINRIPLFNVDLYINFINKFPKKELEYK